MPVLELVAPAKVNLGLRITGRRPDGYHTLDSLFAPLDLGDRVRVELGTCAPGDASGSRIALAVRGLGADALPADARNLAARAAHAFLRAAGMRAELAIDLEKRVPSGAGLGGGSSDAAAVLRALDRLVPGAVAPAALPDIALSLGADVPFFLRPQPARVRGIGERIDPARGLGGLPLALANPGISLSTADVYAAWDERAAALTPPGPRPTMPPAHGPEIAAETLSRLFVGGEFVGSDDDRARVRAVLVNDLLAPAASLCPSIARLLEQLESLGALAVGMSGSGATVFGVFESRGRAEAAVARGTFPPPVWARAVITLASA